MVETESSACATRRWERKRELEKKELEKKELEGRKGRGKEKEETELGW